MILNKADSVKYRKDFEKSFANFAEKAPIVISYFTDDTGVMVKHENSGQKRFYEWDFTIPVKHFIHNTTSYITLFTVVIVIAEIITIIDYEKKYKIVRNDPKKIHVKYQNRIKKTYKAFIHDIFDTEYYIKNKNESILKQLYK